MRTKISVARKQDCITVKITIMKTNQNVIRLSNPVTICSPTVISMTRITYIYQYIPSS